MGKLDQVGGLVVRTGWAALVALPLLAASTNALAADPEWTVVGEQDGVAIFAQNGRYEADQAALAARAIVRVEPTPVQVGDDGYGLLTFKVERPLAPAPIGPIGPRPAALFDNGEGVTYFAP